MKRVLGLGVVLAVIVSAMVFTTPVFADSEVIFPDPALNASVCAAVGISYGDPIMQSELNTVTTYDGDSLGIVNLVGMEHWTSLINLNLGWNNIVDISPLSTLTNLVSLIVRDNKINNIAPLTSLYDLYNLGISSNNISNIYPLMNLKNLTNGLDLSNNPISNISPVSGLTNLQALYIQYCNISDVTSLSNLTNIVVIGLYGDNITNITPLVDTFGVGAIVVLLSNPLSTQAFRVDIPYMLSNGVSVFNDTPYVLTYSVSGGTLSGINPQYVGPTFNGTSVTAIPNSGYEFIGWSDGSTQNPRTDTNVVSDIIVTANFTPIPTPITNSGVYTMASVLPYVFVGIALVLAVGMFTMGYGIYGLILLAIAIVIAIVGVSLIQGLIP